jgi:biopolymer transport protein ExbD
MKLKRKKKIGFMETAAASDLAFLLIIYFIVIAGFNINKGYLLNLPAKDSTRMILKDDLLRFEMDGEGNLIHDSEIIEVPDARKLVASAQNVNPNIAVILTIDPQAQWQNVVHFIEIAQQQKVDSFSFTIKKEAQ